MRRKQYENNMKTQCFNPYLPSWEYIPDGEPHVFGERVYVYGSHDRFHGYAFCLNDYVCYSAPVDDLSDWRYEGVIYGRTDDPKNEDGEMCLYAPDVTQGADGRYYLYYVLDALEIVSVAVCNTPAGRYEFYGYVRYEDGTLLGEREGDEPQFDPGVLLEDGKVYLYTGSCFQTLKERTGPMVTVLEPDMLTVLEPPRTIAPSAPYSKGSSFEGHEFFEASSIRKVGDLYYFVYSSIWGHELCYAVSDSPVEGFQYKGVIVSNRDIGIDVDKKKEFPVAYGGNNHGGMEQINGQWYIFYHRHTNGSSFCRQGCAEPITILKDGTIPQVGMTSCGLNGGPLAGKGVYPAYIACNLYTEPNENRPLQEGSGSICPRITQEGRDGDENPGYVDGMEDGSVAGFQYFDCKDIHEIAVKVRGNNFQGRLEVLLEREGEPIGEIPLRRSNEWHLEKAVITIPDGIRALYFRFRGYGSVSLCEFELKQI